MNIPSYRIEPADFIADHNDLHIVRDAVFVLEQKIPAEIEWDEQDQKSLHLLARDDKHCPIGAGRMTPEGRIGRMAVLNAWRRQGIGSALMQALLLEAQKRGYTEIGLNAQTYIVEFYERFGFVKEGEVFNEAGIPHQRMKLKLDALPKFERRTVDPGRPSIKASKFDGLEEALTAVRQIIKDGRREISLLTLDLEFPLYGHPDITEEFRQFAIRSRDGCIRIVVQIPGASLEQAHPLLELAQKLPSSFQFRTPIEADDLNMTSAYLCNDRDGYLFRLYAGRYTGVWSPALAGRNRQLRDEFERLWQRSKPCTEFRVLSI